MTEKSKKKCIYRTLLLKMLLNIEENKEFSVTTEDDGSSYIYHILICNIHIGIYKNI